MMRVFIFGLGMLLLASCKTYRPSIISNSNRSFYNFYDPHFSFVNDSLKIGYNSFGQLRKVDITRLNGSKKFGQVLKAINRVVQKNGKETIFFVAADTVKFRGEKAKQDFIVLTVLDGENTKYDRNKLHHRKGNFKYKLQYLKLNKYFIGCYVFSKDTSFVNYMAAKISAQFVTDEVALAKMVPADLSFTIDSVFTPKNSTTDYFSFYEITRTNTSCYYKNSNEEITRHQFYILGCSFLHKLDSIKNLFTAIDLQNGRNPRLSPFADRKVRASFNDSLNNVIEKHTNNIGLAKLKQALDTAKIVIVNENHCDWRHRYYTNTLLSDLKTRGFTHFALEALNEDSLHFRNFPVQRSGFYTLEPAMSNLIRSGIAMGYHIFGYEPEFSEKSSDSLKRIYPRYDLRELGMALNIINSLKNNPDGKIIIHCGLGHAFEGGKSNKYFAGILKDLSGLDPITIDQFYLNDLEVTFTNKNLDDFDVFTKGQLQELDSAKISQCDFYVKGSLAFNSYLTKPLEGVYTKKLNLKEILTERKTYNYTTIYIFNTLEYKRAGINALPVYPALNLPIHSIIPDDIYLMPGSYTIIKRDQFGDVIEEKVYQLL